MGAFRKLEVLVICFVVIVNFGCHLVTSKHSKRAHYGAPCNSTVKCDIHSLLTCEENNCVCLYQDAMTYSSELGTCLSLVNEVCGYLETKKVLINCISNAVCDQQQGVCKCTQGYIELDRMCVQQKSYGESCHSDAECKPELSLTCFEEQCQCDPEKNVAVPVPVPVSDEKEEDLKKDRSLKEPEKKKELKCVAKAGSQCTAKLGCVPRANCVSETENADGQAGADTFSRVYGWNHPGVCKCDKGYKTDARGFCRGMHGMYCDVLANISCVEGLRCLNGRCDCKYPDDQVFDLEKEQCLSLFGGPCTTESKHDEDEDEESDKKENRTITACNRFLVCKRGVCECGKGLVENRERGCEIRYGQPCTGESMTKCDRAAGLHCVDGQCSCKDDRKVYDMNSGKCLGKKGASCKVAPKEEHEHKLNGAAEHKTARKVNRKKQMMSKSKSDCIPGMECQVSREQLYGLTTTGICKRIRKKEAERVTTDDGE